MLIIKSTLLIALAIIAIPGLTRCQTVSSQTAAQEAAAVNTNMCENALTLALTSFCTKIEAIEDIDLVRQIRRLHATVSYFRQRRPPLSHALQPR